MPRVRLAANAEIDVLSKGELDHSIGALLRALFAERARGVDDVRFETGPGVSNGTFSHPGTTESSVGPEQGYAWAVERVSAFGLQTNDVIAVHRITDDSQSPPSGRGFLGNITAAVPFLHIGGSGIILKGGEQLLFYGTSLTATSVFINGEGKQVPEISLWKLL